MRTSALMLVPPQMYAQLSCGLWKVINASHSSLICPASSRVGEMASAYTSFLPVGARQSSSIVGRRKPIVFPVPVFALAITSCPLRMTGSVCACTCVQCSYPSTSRTARFVSGEIESASKVVSVRCARVVLLVRAVCSAGGARGGARGAESCGSPMGTAGIGGGGSACAPPFPPPLPMLRKSTAPPPSDGSPPPPRPLPKRPRFARWRPPPRPRAPGRSSAMRRGAGRMGRGG
mmetsp:Transcript_51202/g.90424  ORF Transcript_51202/g.90424 Transcript_51202/m.90424 type:complete len:233 (+) Transcript_51202:414-1112(+)